MPLPAALDAGAVGARQAYPQPAARKPHADFGQAFERAERVARPADDRPVARHDAPAEAERPAADAPTDDAPQAQAPATDAAQAPGDADATAQAAAEAATAQAQADAEAAALAAEAAQAAEALTADATLALMIATGGTAAAPAPTPVATDAQAAAQVAQAAAAVEGAATTPLAAAIAQAQAEAAAPQAAPTEGQAPAATPAAATVAAATPGSLSEAARGLGLSGLQTTTTTAATPAATQTPTNLGLALADAAEATEAPTQLVMGPIAPVTTSDEANGLETSALPLLTEDGDATVEASEAEPSSIPQLNGDRPLSETSRSGPAATAAKADAPVRPDDVLPQLLKHADAMKAQQQNSIKLQLYPEHLGKMEIKVTAHQGVLTAQISADTQNVKAMLETQVVNLQRSLQDLGLKIEKVEVTLASSGAGGFDMAQGQAFGQQGQPNQPGTGQAPRYNAATGYEAWLPEEPAEGASWATGDTQTAVNYVA